MKVLKELFPYRLISLRDIKWTAKLPDLVSLDFFLHGCLKRKVINQPKAALWQKITVVPQEVTRRVMQNFSHRLKLCIENADQHLDDTIFKTN